MGSRQGQRFSERVIGGRCRRVRAWPERGQYQYQVCSDTRLGLRGGGEGAAWRWRGEAGGHGGGSVSGGVWWHVCGGHAWGWDN